MPEDRRDLIWFSSLHLRRLIKGYASLDSWTASTACLRLDNDTYCLECGANPQAVAPSSDTADTSPTPSPPTLLQSCRLQPLPLDALRHRGRLRSNSKFPGSNQGMFQAKDDPYDPG
jgi:hypothetical protein